MVLKKSFSAKIYELRNLIAVFLFLLKWIKRDLWNFRYWRLLNIHLFSYRTEDLLVACNENISSYYYYSFPVFCPGDFSEMAGQISLKFSGKMHYIYTSGSFLNLSKIHFRSANMADFLFLKSHFVQTFSHKRWKIELRNFQGW